MRGVWQTPDQFFSVSFCVWSNLVLIFYDFVAGTILRLPKKKAIGLPYRLAWKRHVNKATPI